MIPRLPLAAALALAPILAGSPALAPAADTATLPDIEVTADPMDAYRVEATVGATRTDTPIEQIPQSVIVVPRAVIEDQGAETLSEVLRNVSNVTALDPRDANNIGFRIRGFTSALVVDGVAMPGYFPAQQSLINVEEVAVVKGPSGALFGSSQGVGTYGVLGGTVAVTTQRPEATPSQRVLLKAGSYDEWGVGFDLNQPLNPEFAVRLSGETSRADSETDRVFFERNALFPSLAWTPNDDTEVVLRLRYLDDTTLDYSGLPPDGTVLPAAYSIPRSRIITAEGLPDTTLAQRGVNLQWTQHLNATWDGSLTAAHNRTEVDQRGVFPWPFGGVGPTHQLAGARLWDEWQATTISPALTARFDTGAAHHTLNLGVDWERTTDDAFMTYSNGMGILDLTFTPVDLRNPVYPAWVEPPEPATPDQQNRYTATVAYVQEQLDLGPWHLLAGLRHSRLDVNDHNTAWGIASHTETSTTTPRVGAVYDLSEQVSLFAGYNEGVKVPTGAIYAAPPKPEGSKQTEVGLRLKDWHGLTATLAWFDLTRENATVGDVANPGFSIQVGEKRTKGIDIDLRWQATPAWSWLAAYTAQQAEVTDDPVLAGKQLFNVPERSGRLATRYDIRGGDWAGLGMGLGLTHHSRLPGDSANTFFTPAATVWDAQLSYQLDKARFGLNVQNLTDKAYWVPSNYFGGGQVIPATPRTVMATVEYAF